jgi:hypothetical protein
MVYNAGQMVKVNHEWIHIWGLCSRTTLDFTPWHEYHNLPSSCQKKSRKIAMKSHIIKKLEAHLGINMSLVLGDGRAISFDH